MVIKRITPVALLAALVLVGCANPADDKPEAKVSEATEESKKAPEGTRFVFDEGSRIEFVGSKVTGSHDGGFNKFTGLFYLVDADPTRSRVEVSIDTHSLWSDNERLTGHLKSPDFFDVEKFPKATFESTSITREANGFTVTGNLDLHGVKKSIQFPATIEVSDQQVTANAEFFIKRFDFGIEYKGRADDLIRDEVVIKLQINAVPAHSSAS